MTNDFLHKVPKAQEGESQKYHTALSQVKVGSHFLHCSLKTVAK